MDELNSSDLIMRQCEEILRLRQQLQLITSERDSLLCTVHSLNMEINGIELGKLWESSFSPPHYNYKNSSKNNGENTRDFKFNFTKERVNLVKNLSFCERSNKEFSHRALGGSVDDELGKISESEIKSSIYSSSEMGRLSSSSQSSSASSSPVLFTPTSSSKSSSSPNYTPHSIEETGETGVVERLYGGPPARDAALVIQRAFRRYSMVKEFQRIKTERRLSKRIHSTISTTAPSGTATFDGCGGDEVDCSDEKRRENNVTMLSPTQFVVPSHMQAYSQFTPSHHCTQRAYYNNSSNNSPQNSTHQNSHNSHHPPNTSFQTPQNSHNSHHSNTFSPSSQFSHQNALNSHHCSHSSQNSHHGTNCLPNSDHREIAQNNCQNSSSPSAPFHSSSPNFSSGVNKSNSPLSFNNSGQSPTAQLNTSTKSPSVSESSETESEILRKRLYRVGLNLFNKKPEVGISYLVKKKFLEGSASSVSRFLISRKGLSKEMIGEYLGNLQSPFSMACLEHFANEIELGSLPVDLALRRFQSFLRMPGEAQKIERIMETFSRRYAVCNPHVVSQFRNGADSIFVLAFAIIMLNTDLHTPHLRADRRMKLEDFVKNLRGIDDGADIDREILVNIYERIKQTEFRTGSDHVTQVMKVQQTIVGKKPNLAVPYRRLVCYCRLYEVSEPDKKERSGAHQREVFLFNDILVLTKIFHKKRNSVSYSFRQSYTLPGITLVLFSNNYYEFGLSLRRGESLILCLNARNEHDRAKFAEDLREAIAESDEMVRIESVSKENRDSGVDVGKIKRFSNSLLDITDSCKPVRRGSCGSLDSGMSISFHSDELHSNTTTQNSSCLTTTHPPIILQNSIS